jgi:high-affinity iron transporter
LESITHMPSPLVALVASLMLLLIPAAAMADTRDVQTAWRLLDYMAVDYGGAVANGAVISASEYAEMTEFAAGVSTRLRALPATPERQSLIQSASQLEAVIGRKGSSREVATLAHGLAADQGYTSKAARPATASPATDMGLTLPDSTRRRSRSPTPNGRASAACSRSIR